MIRKQKGLHITSLNNQNLVTKNKISEKSESEHALYTIVEQRELFHDDQDDVLVFQ